MTQFLLQVVELQPVFLLVVLEIQSELHQHSGNFLPIFSFRDSLLFLGNQDTRYSPSLYALFK